jgi:hypothetical protein
MINEAIATDIDTWPEDAGRLVTDLKEALHVCQADREHYAGIVHDHEFVWDEAESRSSQIEALSVRNAELQIECEKLRAQLRELQSGQARPSTRSPTPNPERRALPMDG